MDKRDNLGKEIKEIMEEETFGLALSQEALDNILEIREKTLKQRILDFLNKEVELPLAPVLIGFVALFAIILIPGEPFKSYEERIIDMGGSQVVIREEYEVTSNEDKD